MSEPTPPALLDATALLNEPERLRTLLELVPGAVFLADARGKVLVANRAAWSLLHALLPGATSLGDFAHMEAYLGGTSERLPLEEWPMVRALRAGQPLDNIEADIIDANGQRRSILGSFAPFHGPTGAVEGVVATVLDVTARRRAERAEAFLSEASRLFSESLEWEETLRAVGHLAVRELADHCIISVRGEGGSFRRIGLYAREPRQQALLEEVLRDVPTRLDKGWLQEHGLHDGRPVLVSPLAPEVFDSIMRVPAYERLVKRLGLHSGMVMPLISRGRLVGSITLGLGTPGRAFTPEDLSYAEEFGRRAALALDNARLYREAREALRARDESLALLRSFLDASPVGMGYMDRELRYREVNPVLAAFTGLSPQAHLGRTPSEVLPPEVTAEFVPLVRNVLERGHRVDIGGAFQAPGSDEQRHLHAWYFPVDVGTERVGVGAMVLDVTEQKQGEATLRFLAEASARLSSSLDMDETLREVAALVVEGLADFCLLDLRGEEGARLERRHVRARRPEVQELLEASRDFAPRPGSASPVLRAFQNGKAEFYPDAGTEVWKQMAQSSEHLTLLERLNPRSIMLVPLVARGRVLGVLSAGNYAGSRRFTERDLALLEDLSSRAAAAVDNASLFHRAEQAVAARDEFVAIATHELRAPLANLSLQVDLLTRFLGEGASMARLSTGLAGAQRQVKRLSELLARLLDVTHLTTGQLELERERVDLSELLRQVIAQLEEPLARAGCPLTVQAEAPLEGAFDKSRLEQVLTNLLSNVVKYAPDAPVELSLERQGATALLRVRDHGPGIPPEQQERIFERFQRASGTYRKDSLGLGLYVSRQLARAHGGDLTVESPPGGGSCFVLRLPLE